LEKRLLHDVFICHASEDKTEFVRPLAEALRSRHVDVWYDEFSLIVGDSLNEAINRGLAQSRFGIVVLSPHFFRKRWAQRELNGLVAREIAEERGVVLPIWHQIDRDEILRHSPPLADVFAISSAGGMDAVLGELLKRLRPEESPLVVARDFLAERGITTPIVTDEWWLDIVEIKESRFRFPEAEDNRWTFPLPFLEDSSGRQRGLNIASTVLQTNWASDGEEQRICQLSHPEKVHQFLRKWPGLFECAREKPGILALYAPQLTIPGYDSGFADVFDALIDPARHDAYAPTFYGGPDTIDGNEPLCGELIAWRHPSFGNYTDREIAYSFVKAHTHSYSRDLFSIFECLTWLLSDHANWMPNRIREFLLEGTRKRDLWFHDIIGEDNAFSTALLHRTRSKFRFTRTVRAGLNELITRALVRLDIEDAPEAIAARFISRGFIEGYFEERERIRDLRRSHQ
jgi:hypothetical protein